MPQQWFRLSFSEDALVEHPLQADADDLLGIDRFDLEIGKHIDAWNPNASLRSTCPEKDGDPDDVLCEHLGVQTFSPRLQEALAKANVGGRDIQYLPVRVFKSTGEEIQGFAFANVITRLPALDYENSTMLEQDESEIDPLTGKLKVIGIWTAALRESVLDGHDIIRLTEFFPPVFVSERFAEVFWAEKFTGAVLVPIK